MSDGPSSELFTDIRRIIEGMEWEEVVSMLMEVIEAELSQAPPAEPPAPQLSLGGSQNLPNASWFHPLPPGSMQGQEANAPHLIIYPMYVVHPPSTVQQVHQPPAPLSCCSSPSNQEYVKKPPNAFMLYLKEQRAKVKAELNITNSSALNKVLGDRWTSLSPDNKEKYFQEAHQERKLFQQRHPGWSSAQNYGKRKRKRTGTAATAPAAAAAAPDAAAAAAAAPPYARGEESGPGNLLQAKRPCRRPENSGSAPPPPLFSKT
ncbi:transcription factor 7-like 1-A isoform X1 [Oryzias latipes]